MALLYNVSKYDYIYTQWISSCSAAARERIPRSIDNYVTGVSERSQQSSSLKDEGYKTIWDVVEDIYLLFKVLIMMLHEINFYSIGFSMVY